MVEEKHADTGRINQEVFGIQRSKKQNNNKWITEGDHVKFLKAVIR